MGRLVNSTYISLDGVVERPQDFTFDVRSDDAAKYARDLLMSSDAVVMGRRTYEVFAASWPTMPDPDGSVAHMNSIPHHVVSDTLRDPEWANTVVVPRAETGEHVRRLKDEVGTVVQYGYGPVTAELLDEGLVDELHLWVHPVFVGRDDPADLISAVHTTGRMELLDVIRCTSGLVILSYRPG